MSTTQRYGMTIPFAGVPLGEQRDWFRELVDLGYTDVWSSEADGADAFTPLALASVWAPELRLGTAIVPAYTRGPALPGPDASARWPRPRPVASCSASAASSNVIVERWNDIPFEEPYKRTRDMVRFLRDALTGEKVTPGVRHVLGQRLQAGRAPERARAHPRRRPAGGDAAPRRPGGRRRHHQLAVGRRRVDRWPPS